MKNGMHISQPPWQDINAVCVINSKETLFYISRVWVGIWNASDRWQCIKVKSWKKLLRKMSTHTYIKNCSSVNCTRNDLNTYYINEDFYRKFHTWEVWKILFFWSNFKRRLIWFHKIIMKGRKLFKTANLVGYFIRIS